MLHLNARQDLGSPQWWGASGTGAVPGAGPGSPCAAGQTPFCCSPLLFSAETTRSQPGILPQNPEYFPFSCFSSFFGQVWERCGGEGSRADTGCVYCAWQLAANAKGSNADFLHTGILISDLFYR